MKRMKMTYWILLAQFSLMMLMDGVSGIMHVEEGKKAFDQLGYPYYLMTIIGISKIIGILVLLQTKYKILKEWAFAGFTINFLGAAASWAFSGAPMSFTLLPLIMLFVLFAIYYLWKVISIPIVESL